MIKQTEKPTKQTFDKWHADPANWKFGIFYYNRQDKRIFPPKRTYLGWTINFANPISVLFGIAIGLIIVLIIRYLNGLNK